jgi:hypothetical protein
MKFKVRRDCVGIYLAFQIMVTDIKLWKCSRVGKDRRRQKLLGEEQGLEGGQLRIFLKKGKEIVMTVTISFLPKERMKGSNMPSCAQEL